MGKAIYEVGVVRHGRTRRVEAWASNPTEAKRIVRQAYPECTITFAAKRRAV